MLGKRKRLERRLEERGRPAPARVLDCHHGWTTFEGSDAFPTDVHVDCKLRLEVQPPGEPAFDAETSGQFASAAVPSVGDVIDVLYDPEDHDKVVVSEPSLGQGRVNVQIVRRPGGDPSRPLPTITVNGQVVQAGDQAPAGTGASADPVEEIARLAELRDRGLLTDAEFQAQKTKLLDRL